MLNPSIIGMPTIIVALQWDIHKDLCLIKHKISGYSMKLRLLQTLGVIYLFCRWEQLYWNSIVIIISHAHLWTWLESVVHCTIGVYVLTNWQCINHIFLIEVLVAWTNTGQAYATARNFIDSLLRWIVCLVFVLTGQWPSTLRLQFIDMNIQL